jgi:hypothetical protein
MKRLAFLATMVVFAACATEGSQTDSAAAADSVAAAMTRDSAQKAQMRLDSLRADSLRKDSVAKGLIKDTTAAK